MKKHVKIKGRLKINFRLGIYLGILLAVIAAGTFFINIYAGVVVLSYTFIYFALTLGLFFYNRPVITNELVSFATEYGQVMKRMLKEHDVPYLLLDENGKIIWANNAFSDIVHEKKLDNKPFNSFFASIAKEKMPNGRDIIDTSFDIVYEERDYDVKMHAISLAEMARQSEVFDGSGFEGFMTAVYLYDQTALHIALREVDDQSLSVGLVYLDNYEEALVSIEEVRRSLLMALVDRAVNKYISGLDGICKKLEKDKYLVVLRKKALQKLVENRFDILEEIKSVNIGNGLSVTLSIGVGVDGITYAQNYEFAHNAIDLALGRGGDQAVLKTPLSVTYYGGKSQQIDRNTRVKARVKAHALREIITSKDKVLVMGHSMADVDSFGAAVGIYRVAQALERKAQIVLNDATASVKPLVEMFKNNPEYEEDMIIGSEQAIELANNNTVLVVVDVNRPGLTECPDLLKICKTIVVLDHHRQGTDTIENATLSYVEPFASSACEMVSEILQYTNDNVKIRPEEADCMYSGIMIDTSNFMTKAGVKTFEAAAFLKRNGADITHVRKLFREDPAEYIAKADAIRNSSIYRQFFAISECKAGNLESPTIVGAQAANELLDIKGIKASFVFTDYQNKIFLSARSIDDVNVQIIMEKLGGGGHMNAAAVQFENSTVEEATAILKETLDKMLDGGEI